MSFGYTMIAGFLLCFFMGFWADQVFETGYRYSLIGLGLAIAFCLYEVWKIVRKKD